MERDRRSLLDGDRTPTHENPNIFDDEFEVEDFSVVADGFRPQSHDREGGGGRQDVSSEEEEPIRSAAAHVSSPSVSVTPAEMSRSSTRKSRGQQNPFSSPEDGEGEGEGMLVRTPSGNFDVARRSVSSASSHQFARTSSPRFGAGPSHPYNMYPQGTMARTPSVATTSTIRPQRQSSARGPQHPYALYTQGVGDDDLDDEHETAQNPLPVGFLGAGGHYQRRRGADGEEQDLLGDFGHTEQLPPYTRYPEAGPEKMPLLDVPNPPNALHSRAPVLGSDPGMDLMHTQLQAATPQQSMTDESQLDRRSTVSSRRSLVPSAHPSSQEDSLDSEKSWKEKNWREKRRSKVCGVPCWWYIVITGALVFIAAMLGGVLGGFVAGQNKGQAKALAAAAKTSLYDASVIVTSTTRAPPATGTFALPLGTAEAPQAQCLTNAGQQAAWDCDLVGAAELQIVIETPPGSNQPGAYITVDVDDTYYLSYGTQRSSMATLFSPFLLVKDIDAPEKGPAYYFQQQYNKLALIPEEALEIETGKIKRDFMRVPEGYRSRKEYAAPSDRPWLCYWNNTFVEGFIYPKEEADEWYEPIESSLPPTSATSASSWSYSSSEWSIPYPFSGSYGPYTTPWAIPSAKPYEQVTTTVVMPTTTCTYEGKASDFPDWMEANYPGWYASKGTAYPPRTTRPPKAKGKSKRSSHKQQKRNHDKDDPAPYPFLIKIEERRLPGSPHPYCNKIQILDDLNWNFVPASDDEDPVTIQLSERDPAYQAYVDSEKRDAAGAVRLRKRRLVPGECHCQWQSGADQDEDGDSDDDGD